MQGQAEEGTPSSPELCPVCSGPGRELTLPDAGVGAFCRSPHLKPQGDLSPERKADPLFGSSEGRRTRPACGVVGPWSRADPVTYLPHTAGHPVCPSPALCSASSAPSEVTWWVPCCPPCAHAPPVPTRQAQAGTFLRDEGMNEGVGPGPVSRPGPSSGLCALASLAARPVGRG